MTENEIKLRYAHLTHAERYARIRQCSSFEIGVIGYVGERDRRTAILHLESATDADLIAKIQDLLAKEEAMHRAKALGVDAPE